MALFISVTWIRTAGAESLSVLMSRADWNCVHIEPTGQACVRMTPPYEGVQVRYWQPVLLVETVKRPGETAINEFQSMVGLSLRQAAASAMGESGGEMDSGSSSSQDTTTVQMNDVHVFGFPSSSTVSSMIEPVCEGPADLSSTVSYLSEKDAVEWRTLKNESRHPLTQMTAMLAPACDTGIIPPPGICIGVWGPLYPRGGFITGHSAVVGSGAAAYRGVDIASINPLSAFHQREIPLMFVPDMFWDRMQLVYPAATRCLMIGEDPRFWEEGRGSPDGKYVWIYWRKKECCAL